MTRKELTEFNKKRKVTQICYVTDDYKKTIEYMTEKLCIGPWFILANTNESAYDVTYEGEPVTEPWRFLIAISQIGDTQIEVIQPVYGKTTYDQFLKEKGPGIHHFKECFFDDEEMLAHVEFLKERGNKFAYFGRYQNDIYAYFDTYKELGAFFEVGNGADVKHHPELVGFYPEE